MRCSAADACDRSMPMRSSSAPLNLARLLSRVYMPPSWSHPSQMARNCQYLSADVTKTISFRGTELAPLR